jgi:hypothetical protein
LSLFVFAAADVVVLAMVVGLLAWPIGRLANWPLAAFDLLESSRITDDAVEITTYSTAFVVVVVVVWRYSPD